MKKKRIYIVGHQLSDEMFGFVNSDRYGLKSKEGSYTITPNNRDHEHVLGRRLQLYVENPALSSIGLYDPSNAQFAVSNLESNNPEDYKNKLNSENVDKNITDFVESDADQTKVVIVPQRHLATSKKKLQQMFSDHEILDLEYIDYPEQLTTPRAMQKFYERERIRRDKK